jgi:hypothetical protein
LCLIPTAALGALLALAGPGAPGAEATVVRGGGARRSDCIAVFDVPAANRPAPPREPRRVDCADGDPACDADGARNGRCEFAIRLCINSTAVSGCAPDETDSLTVAHAEDNGDPRFDPDFQALQLRANLFDFPGNLDVDACTLSSTLTVALRGPTARNRMRRGLKLVRLTTAGMATGRAAVDRDRMRFVCRPDGDGVYLPRDLYAGTFDRISQQVFAPRCALSGCHDSESFQNDLELLPNSAYGQILGVPPFNATAAAAGLLRITPGEPTLSYLYRKVTFDLDPGWGSGMPLTGLPLSSELTELLRLWIIGDPTLGPAPQTGWVVGTDG